MITPFVAEVDLTTDFTSFDHPASWTSFFILIFFNIAMDKKPMSINGGGKILREGRRQYHPISAQRSDRASVLEPELELEL